MQNLTSGTEKSESCESQSLKELNNTSDKNVSEYKSSHNAARKTEDVDTESNAKGENNGQKQFQNSNANLNSDLNANANLNVKSNANADFIAKGKNTGQNQYQNSDVFGMSENVQSSDIIVMSETVQCLNSEKIVISEDFIKESISDSSRDTKSDLHKSMISNSIEADNKMADVSFAPKRKFPPEFRAQTNCFDMLRAKTEPPQHKRRRAERLLLDPVPTGILQSKATRWPMQTLPEKLRQQLLISQEGYAYILSKSNSDLLVLSEPLQTN